MFVTTIWAAQQLHTTPNNHFDISYYDSDVTDYDANCTLAEIQDLGILLEDLRALYVNNFGLEAPATNFDVRIFNFTGIPNGSGWCSKIKLDPYWLGPRWMDYGTGDIFFTPTDTEKISIPAHELFHVIQCISYGGTNPSWTAMKWIIEGQARMMQDKIDIDVDQSVGDKYDYFSECNYFLGNTKTSLLDQSYSACLFWNYITEQYGGTTAFFQNEPYIGIDLITEFWDIAHSNSRVNGINTVNDALQALGHSATFEEVFRNFTVTNYVKDLTGTVPTEYKYIDEEDPPGHYDYDNNPATPPVRLKADIELGASDRNDGDGNLYGLYDWSTHYYRIKPSNDAVAINIQVDQSTNNALAYHVLVIDGNDLVQEYRVRGKDLKKSILNKDYDEIVLVISGLDNSAINPAKYKFEFTTGTAEEISMEIDSPKGTPAAARSRVGDNSDPEEFLSIIDLKFKGSALCGLESSDFTAKVGTETASISTIGYVMGKYFLLIQAPPQTAVGLYDLRIGLDPTIGTTIEDGEVNAIEYDGLAADNVLVIDRSGSMTGPGYPPTYIKINSAKIASKLYIDSFLNKDKVSVVDYNETAVVSINLQDLTDAARTTSKNIIEELIAQGMTSIGDGLKEAQDQLALNGDSSHNWVIILLSDGKENRQPSVETILPDILGNGTTVHTVAIGPEANVTLLRDLAYSTSGGTFNFASEPSSGDLPNDLADIYRKIAEKVDYQQRILSARGSGIYWDQSIPIEEGAEQANFVFNYDRYSSYFSPNATLLIDPNGNTIPFTHFDNIQTPTGSMGYLVWRVDNPTAGTWRITNHPKTITELIHTNVQQPQITPIITVQEEPITTYLIEASVRHALKMNLWFPLAEYYQEKESLVGEPISIIVSLSETQPITNAHVEALITNPKTAQSPSEIHNMQLFDDGAHGDGAPNDGVYGNVYTRTFQNGTFTVKAKATGVSPVTSTDFLREVNGAFYIAPDVDSDRDLLPDTWETQYGLSPDNAQEDDGANGDPDEDGLTNKQEFYYGTDPTRPDTDGGGETDGSEVETQKDPNNPGDDIVNPPRTISVVPGNKYLELHYSINQEYEQVIIYRSRNPNTGYKIVTSTNPTGFFNDTNVENEITYYYKVAGVDINGAKSAPSRWAKGTPREDTELPEGIVLINMGEEKTTNSQVILTLLASPDTVEMKISNVPVFDNVEWITFTNQKEWTLEDGKDLKDVYVLYKDENGNIAELIAHDSIVVTTDFEIDWFILLIIIIIVIIIVVVYFIIRH